MSKINNTKISLNVFYTLFILLILGLALGVLIPVMVYAEGGTNYIYGTSSGSSYNSLPYSYPYNYNQNYINYNNNPYYYAPAPEPLDPNSAPPIYSNSANPHQVKIVAVKKTSSTKVVSIKPVTTENSSLAANAFFGANSFLPTGLIQWIIFAILLLILIILIRKISGGEKEYHETPLK